MTGADADTEQEVATDQADTADSASLARFLTPVPRPRNSVPAPDHDPREVVAAAALAPQRTSLFDDLLVPRRNSSLLPPPGDATTGARTPELDDESTDEVVGKEPEDDEDDEFDEHESPTSNLTLEKNLDDELDSDEDDFVRLPRSPASILSTRGAGTALASIVLLVVIVFAWSRAGRPVRDAAVTGVAAGAPAAAPAPAEEIAEPLDDPGYEVPTPDVEKGLDLRREARRHLEAGRAEEGVAVARRAIEADANDPEGYILLAAGLQDLGRWQESRDVFVKCVRESNGKANAECVYFATRSK